MSSDLVLRDDQATEPASARPGAAKLRALDEIQNRILWLAVRIVHEANSVRPNLDGLKVGGHQASSASVVSILTALYCGWLRATDLVAVKPHASPAFHAVQYLLGGLERAQLTRLRSFGGLQAYPSRTKDLDRVDFSTGSVGLGAVAPLFCSLADRYIRLHLAEQARSWPERRFVALVGDAELDEGNVWEAVLDDALAGLGNVVWIIDVNRQSLDRVIPGIHVARVKAMFADAGWDVFDIKYGRRLQECFRRPGGAALRDRIDEMANEEYQVLIRRPGVDSRARLIEGAPAKRRDDLAAVLDGISDARLPGILADLGGHDITELTAALDAAAAERRRPSAIFAYTVKGWRLPFAGDSLNHSALLLPEQVEALAQELGADAADPWAAFDPDSPPGRICRAAAERLGIGVERPRAVGRGNGGAPAPAVAPPAVGPPADLDTRATGRSSTQQAFGEALVELARDGRLGARLVTASPDVAISTNLGGWINRVGVFSAREEPSFEVGARILEWKPRPAGQHIELGISEMNLFMWLCQFGLAGELLGEPLIPIGTVYDPFICRALDGLIYGLYSGARFILVGTPSGISLSAEGGAHQSTVTPSLGIELPGLITYEPAFGQEVVWALLAGIEACLAGPTGHSTYLRLTTRPIDQAAAAPVLVRLGRDTWREHVLAGGYRLLEAREIDPDLRPDAPVVEIVVSGALVPEAVAAARSLVAEEAAANVIVLTSPGRLFGDMQTSRLKAARGAPLDAGGHAATLFPANERRAPIVAVADAAPHALAFLGSVYGTPVVPLGVSAFGQSGTIPDLYRAAGIDADHIIEAALVALELAER